jgi:hypothetical protein
VTYNNIFKIKMKKEEEIKLSHSQQLYLTYEEGEVTTPA